MKNNQQFVIKFSFLLALLSLVLLYNGCKKDTVDETCSDGIMNQGETSIDCGGPCTCNTASCSDGIMNNGETSIDCGGPNCTACPLTARDSAILDYNTTYLPNEVSSPGWTGDVSSCNAGSAPQSTHDKVILRINYFRRLVGLNDNTTLDASLFQKYQEAALMMKANNALSHSPPNTWTCWTQLGADGAATSNLYLGIHSTAAVTGFIMDPGASNIRVGHRRWVLHSPKTKFSYGTTDNSMSLGVIGLAGGNTKIPEFIAYPPKGYIPQPLMNTTRWSFGIPDADFSNATVTMTGVSGAINLTVVSNDAVGYGDNTIVWEPQGLTLSSESDISYTVTVSGVANAPKTTYTYTTILVKP